jgi:hypothetical protein
MTRYLCRTAKAAAVSKRTPHDATLSRSAQLAVAPSTGQRPISRHSRQPRRKGGIRLTLPESAFKSRLEKMRENSFTFRYLRRPRPAVAMEKNRVIDAALTAHGESGWFGALRARHFGESPLAEDNSARSPAYTTVDAQPGFQIPHHWLVAVDVSTSPT